MARFFETVRSKSNISGLPFAGCLMRLSKLTVTSVDVFVSQYNSGGLAASRVGIARADLKVFLHVGSWNRSPLTARNRGAASTALTIS